jgi:hypothetical protein
VCRNTAITQGPQQVISGALNKLERVVNSWTAIVASP